MPDAKDYDDQYFFDEYKAELQTRYFFNGQNGSITLDYSEQLARIEQKLDRLLAILDKDRGLWVAPGPTEPFGHWEDKDNG